MKKANFTEQGNFSIGCNYWASHAGTAMWSDWRPDIIENDLKQFSDNGINVIRAFPLWPDFQPITLLKGGCGEAVEFTMGENPLPETKAGRAGISEEMMKRFAFMADKTEKNGMKLLVGLLTGWMSGRLFVPPAFENLNPLKDPSVIIWEVRFVKYFVTYFKNHPAIIGWDLGNECNVMGQAESRENAWTWASLITNTIKSVDSSRPVVSGMHSLKIQKKRGNWTVHDQAEITDILTTHPYPLFTPYCGQDPINEMRNGLHATAESCMYSDIGGKPCLIEEIGTLGPMICDDNIAADYAGTALFSAWAHDLRSFQWWCAYDQNLLEHAPYEWKAIERRLGLFEADRTPKPVVEKYSEFRKFLESTPALPPRKKDAVCILSSGQDHWGAAFSTFILAKQAGFDIEFQYIEQTLKNSPFYILPCIETADSIPGRKWHELLGKVQKGATLYMSMGNGIVEPFNGPLGIELQTSQQRKAPFGYSFDGVSFRSCSRRKINIKNISAEVIGRENDGNPVFIRNKYGKGQIYFIAAPIEQEASETPGAFHEEDAQPLHLIYRKISEGLLNERLLNKDCIYAGITEHHLSENEFAAVLTNYSSSTRTVKTLTAEGWKITEFVYGPKADNGVFEMPGNSTAVFNVKRIHENMNQQK